MLTPFEGTCPVMAMTGEESMWALAMPVTRFVAPGPEVAKHTPGLPLARAYPSAACAAPCSCLLRMWRILESQRASYIGRLAPPSMPKMAFTFCCSRDSIRAFAPDILVILHAPDYC